MLPQIIIKENAMDYRKTKIKTEKIAKVIGDVESIVENYEKCIGVLDQLSPEVYAKFNVQPYSHDVNIYVESREDLHEIRKLLRDSFGSWSDELDRISHLWGDEMVVIYKGEHQGFRVDIRFNVDANELDLAQYGMPNCQLEKSLPDYELHAQWRVSCPTKEGTTE